MTENLIDFDFELNLNFEGHKNPSEAFVQLAKMYEKLIVIDKHILYNILPQASIEYELTGIEFSSIKSKIVQILKAIPDDILKDIADPKKLFGHVLVAIKYRIIKAIENSELQSKDQLEKLTNAINKEIKTIPLNNVLYLEVNNYFVLNSLNDIVLECKKLRKTESFTFHCQRGTAIMKNHANVNMAKILFELGDQKFEKQRVETLKVKSLDLLSEKASWSLIRQGKQIDVKILDLDWLKDYHDRKVIIQPNDYLKLELKIIYTTSPNLTKPIVNYEALKVFEVIPPQLIEDNSQSDIFDNI
jgi:hypothetical protein